MTWADQLSSRVAALRLYLQSSQLQSRVLGSGGMLLAADLYANGIRLLGNLIITRLLYPEAFGLMLIVNLAFTALDMISDIGLRSAIIVQRSSISSSFLNTIWTLSILRGMALGTILLLAAPYIAEVYGEPELLAMLQIASLAPLINGFASLAPILQEKQIRMTRVVVWKSATQTLSLGILICWLLVDPTVYALAANGVVSAIISVIISYVYFQAKPHKLCWEKSVVFQTLHRGKWIFLATGLAFLSRQGDGLILSRFVSTELLGIFSIAVGFAKLGETLVDRLTWSLLFPVYSELRERGPTALQPQLRKVRLALYAISTPFILLFGMYGDILIQFLYDPRFHAAGWMLQVMASGAVFYAISAAVISIPMSFDHAQRHMWLQFVRFCILLGSMLVGGKFYGTQGLVAGIAISQLLFYPIVCIATYRYRVHDYLSDGLYALTIASILLLSWTIRGNPIF